MRKIVYNPYLASEMCERLKYLNRETERSGDFGHWAFSLQELCKTAYVKVEALP